LTRDDRDEPVFRLLQLLGDRLESFLDGDETALETLGESIEEQGFSADDLGAAILVMRSFAGARVGGERAPWAGTPGKRSLRVPSAEERDRMSPEAWGYLLDLKARGSLDPEQFERVLDLLVGSGVRPVDVDLARDVATRVALDVGDPNGLGEMRHGDFDLAH
jgi:uncharacterized protein Smg (DUF494 family)